MIATTNDYIVHGPRKFHDGWPSLKQANFEQIDAVLPHPTNRYEAYFFSGNQYVLIKFRPGQTKDSIVGGPRCISGNWPSLDKAGFSSVSTILPNPANKKQAYFFFRDKYALIDIAPGTTNDTIVNGPKFTRSEWPSLRQAGF